MTFDIAIDESNDLLLKDYMSRVSENISEIAQKSTIEMISDIYYLSAKSKALMEEYKKNPTTIPHQELMKEYGLA